MVEPTGARGVCVGGVGSTAGAQKHGLGTVMGCEHTGVLWEGRWHGGTRAALWRGRRCAAIRTRPCVRALPNA